jgi:lysophospholipase L1-like esterase
MTVRPKSLLVALVAAALLFTGCAPATSEETVEEPTVIDPDAPLVAFYGDSYTRGTGASDPSLRWSTVICNDRGWNEFNPSWNGLGFVNNRSGAVDLPDQIIDVQPDIVFITMGLNDNFAYGHVPDDEILARIDDDFHRLNTEIPGVRLIVVEPFWYTDERPESVEIIIGWVRDAAERYDADWIPDASHWIEGHPEWMAPDGLHPNDDGYAEIARQMDAALTELGL